MSGSRSGFEATRSLRVQGGAPGGFASARWSPRWSLRVQDGAQGGTFPKKLESLLPGGALGGVRGCKLEPEARKDGVASLRGGHLLS